MKSKIIQLVLIASLAFNVFFVVGTFTAHDRAQQAATQEEWIEVFVAELDLSPEQETDFRKWNEDYRADRDRRREEMRAQGEKFLNEIAREEPDEAVISEFIASAPGPEWREQIVDRTRQMMAILTPEQRIKAVELIRERFDRRRQSRPKD